MRSLIWKETNEVSKSKDLIKRFWLCSHADYEPCGGILDLEGSFDSVMDAIDAVENARKESSFKITFCTESGYIYDSVENKIVMRFSERHFS